MRTQQAKNLADFCRPGAARRGAGVSYQRSVHWFSTGVAGRLGPIRDVGNCRECGAGIVIVTRAITSADGGVEKLSRSLLWSEIADEKVGLDGSEFLVLVVNQPS